MLQIEGSQTLKTVNTNLGRGRTERRRLKNCLLKSEAWEAPQVNLMTAFTLSVVGRYFYDFVGLLTDKIRTSK